MPAARRSVTPPGGKTLELLAVTDNDMNSIWLVVGILAIIALFLYIVRR